MYVTNMLTNYERKCMMILNQDIGIPVWKYHYNDKQMFLYKTKV